MDKKNFDLPLVKKINLLIQKNFNSNDSPFEWFVVGFLYAHPHNVQTLDKIFADVHTVISLNKTNNFLTPDDTNEILIRMINNLISSQISTNILGKRPEITFISDNEKPKSAVGKSSPSKSKASSKAQLVNGDSPHIDLSLSSATDVNNKPSGILGLLSKSTKATEIDDISYDSGEEFKPKKGVQTSEDLFKDNRAKKTSTNTKKSPIRSSESLISTLKTKEDKTPAGNKSTTKEPANQPDILADDLSFESDPELKPKVKTRNAPKQEEKKPSTSKAKLVEKSPAKTPNKGGFKLTNNPPAESIKAAALEQKYLEDDHSYESENNLIEIDTKKDRTPTKSGKASMIKEEQEVNHNLTASSFAQWVQKKSVTKDPPKQERKKSGDTEDIFISEPEETKSLIARQAQMKAGAGAGAGAGKKLVDKKSTDKDLVEQEFKDSAGLLSAMQKRTSNAHSKQSTKVKKEKGEDSWDGISSSPFERVKKKEDSGKSDTLSSQKKQKAVQLANVMDDLIISLEDDTPLDQEISMNNRFKKQKVSKPNEFEMTLEVDHKVKEAPSFSRKPKPAQLIDDSECIQLVETPPESPKQIYFTKKSMNKDSTNKNEINLIEDSLILTRKPVDRVQVDQPKSAKELRDARRFMSHEDEEKLSKAYIEKLQVEESKERKGAAGSKRKKQ